MNEPRKIIFPKIRKVKLEGFDLYSHNPNVEVDIEKDVFCLIGANGLGKSTFLNAVNFAITGAIPDPLRRFQTAQEYFRDVARVDRVVDYFSGRIKEGSRSFASVAVVLEWPDSVIEVKREVFSGRSVCELSIASTRQGACEKFSRDDVEDEDQLLGRYESEVLHLCKLGDFSQFVFIFHFISTFDEGRHLLLWDDGALTNALYLAFGTDASAVKTAEKLKREMERESSRGRNIRFSARHVADRIKELMNIIGGNPDGDYFSEEELRARHRALVERLKYTEERLRVKQSELRDIDVQWTDLSASLSDSTLEYERAFSQRIKKSSTVEHHPIVRTTLNSDECAVCGRGHVAEIIRDLLDKHKCPLCTGNVESSSSSDVNHLLLLQGLDKKIVGLRESLAETIKIRERLSIEVDAAEAEEMAAHAALQKFESEEAEKLARLGDGVDHNVLKSQIEKLERERQEFLQQSKSHYKKRDELRDQLRVYERQLRAQYDIGSEIFVPRFRELSEEFIGLPIDIELEHRSGANDSGFGLRLRMNDQLRSRPDKLSESQRFFLDIALRMALAEFMSSSPATLLIDTPEGSLDIAYEARAGAMFSKFAKEGNSILMTANLRSSELVHRLAELQKRKGMQVIRMTDWTDLSEVQQSEEPLFLKAYDEIESALQ